MAHPQSPRDFELTANLVDVVGRRRYAGTLTVRNGRIAAIREESPSARYPNWLLPGFVDAHVHIESSMLPPAEFARLAVRHGVVATVSDPHEIANVLGAEGVWYMVEDAERSPLKFFFGAPSCVPATPFDRAGGSLDAAAVGRLLDDPRIKYLSEMMNFPGVLHDDPLVLAKLGEARRRGKPIDGHAPGVRGPQLAKYIAAGISTDHESRAFDEGREKLDRGMKLIIREGSAAKDFEALAPLVQLYPDRCMFCSDDKHPDELTQWHINALVKRSLALGAPLFDALQAACVNPVRHYGLPVGLLQVGDPADFVEVDDLSNFNILRTFIDGHLTFDANVADPASLVPRVVPRIVNQFSTPHKQPAEFRVPAQDGGLLVIEAIDGQLVTGRSIIDPRVSENQVVADPQRDLLKIVLADRYGGGPPAVAFIRRFGLRTGAIASSVSHDSHNLIAVGCTDDEIATAINALIDVRGGISVAEGNAVDVLPLPIAGLMSDRDGREVAAEYSRLDRRAKELGSQLSAPFMTLSFMALTVIPELKLGPQGLFDVEQFAFVPMFV